MDKLFKFSLKMLLTYLLLASPSARRIVHVVKYAVEDATQSVLSFTFSSISSWQDGDWNESQVFTMWSNSSKL